MSEQVFWKRKLSLPALLLGPLLAWLLWLLNPVAFFSNACWSPFASPYDRAVALDDYGDKSGAVAGYSVHLRDHPDDVEAFFRRGMAYVRLGESDRAIADLTEVLQRRPDDYGAARWRGDAELIKGDYERAIADYSRSMERPGADPALSYPFYPRGLAYLGAGRYAAAQADFAKAIAADPSNTYAAKGRDCAARGSRDGDCGSLPLDPNPAVTQIVDMAHRAVSDCYDGPGKI